MNMKWLALAVGLGSVWWLLRIVMRQPDQPETGRVSAAWMREQSYDRSGY